MNLFLNKLLSNFQPTTTPTVSRQGYCYSTSMQGPDKDTFVKGSSNISFTGKRSNGSTKKGDCLKELENITCPYSGIRMITSKKMDKIERDIAKSKSLPEQMEVVEKYRPCMQRLEKNIYSVFKGYEINNPDGTVNDCLNELKPECLAELRISELQVLDGIDNISNKLDAKTALEIRKVTTEARKIILEDNQDKIFKRKDILAKIHDVTQDHPSQDVVREMWQKANELPKSTNDFNAFVVKYANRSPQEILARLLRPSVASIEHIRPANPCSEEIEAGKDDLTNFMLAARDWNSGRGNQPLPDFIKKHPNIPKYSQMYMNDIIKAIHKNHLKDCNWYPYVIKEKLYNESEGLIDVNLDKYKLDKETAFIDAPEDVIGVYNDLLEKNKSITKK